MDRTHDRACAGGSGMSLKTLDLFLHFALVVVCLVWVLYEFSH